MFYSHEVLTSRKYGVATVWLVATLGAKSNLKKINRKAIRDVDVPKACRTIIDPAAPMALRLQGNLLYGVSRVYLEQCGYVLSDAQNAQNAMRLMLTTLKTAALDPDAGRAKPEHLILRDDPSFLPEFALPPPELLADLNLPLPLETPRSGESQSLTPVASQRQLAAEGGLAGGLVIPSSSSPVGGELRVEGDYGLSSVGGVSGVSRLGGAELLSEPDFGFDDEGNMIDLTAGEIFPGTLADLPGAVMLSDAGASARVRQEHEEGQLAGTEQLGEQMDLELPILGDDLPEGESFPAAARQQPGGSSAAPDNSSIAAVPMLRKKRVAKIIPSDLTMELANRDLTSWNANYLKNMAEAAHLKNRYRIAKQAKKNAEYWVWGAGIGGVGRLISGAVGLTPYDMFHGDNLFELYTGHSRKSLAGRKHDRDSGLDDETQGQPRRVRPKSDEDSQVGRGDEDEGMFILGDDEVELPREAPSALDDQQVFSAMPWNISASIRGSSAVPRSGVGALSTGNQESLRQRGSRMVSASPLHGRGQPGGLEALRSLGGEEEFGNFGLEDFGMPPGPSSDSVHVEASVRVREALSTEGENFLSFVSDAIAKKRNRAQAGLEPMSDVLQAEAAADIDEVLFEELLPPEQNTTMVACQGLMMVLALGTKDLLNVRQDKSFAEIGLTLTDKARVMQPDQVAEEGGVEEEQVRHAGQFEEQMAARAGGGATDDDHDSLYDL